MEHGNSGAQVAGRWSGADVLSLAADGRAAGAARRLAVATAWRATGCTGEAVWGVFHGSSAEPYQVVVSLAGPTYRCSCPSRKVPCKHALALLLLWSAGAVAEATPPAFAAEWIAHQAGRAAAQAIRETDADPPADEHMPPVSRRPRTGGSAAAGGPGQLPPPSDRRALERAERVASGLREFDRWLTDVVRTGLTAPALARYATWDAVAARLVDAQAPALANRVKRLAGAIASRPGWHEHVLGELGTLHLLSEAGLRLRELEVTEPDLADSVRTALGWTIRQADVLARPPESDRWVVCGRSDTAEDRIVVRRTWLRGVRSQRWALLLSFAAGGQTLDEPLVVGSVIAGDLHRYPGRDELRCAPGPLQLLDEAGAGTAGIPGVATLAGACSEVGRALAAVPWIERWPVTFRAAPTLVDGRWVFTDHSGSLPIVAGPDGLAPLVALSGGRAVDVTAEWTTSGLMPLAVHLAHRSADLGPSVDTAARPWRAS